MNRPTIVFTLAGALLGSFIGFFFPILIIGQNIGALSAGAGFTLIERLTASAIAAGLLAIPILILCLLITFIARLVRKRPS